MKRILSVLLAVAMIASTFLFVSCAKNPAENEGTKTEAEETAKDPAENEEAKTEAEENVAVIGYTIYEPMNYEENGELVGFDTELAKAVFEKIGYKPVFKLIDWDQKYTELNSGAITCIWNGFTANTADDDGVARADKVDFSYNYMGNKQVIVAKADLAKNIADAKSLSGKVGAVEASSAGDTYLTKELTGAIKKGVTSQLDAMKDLSMGAVDFAV
ncbi:MAG: transporter substrate-binding domain-containing protein, partial [Clostridia bacterium]|nr:transporter substrate-binding domain-containing protein [Clostridia bacterium]